MSAATVETGKKAPAFTLSNQDGDKVKLSDLAGQWVVLYFYPKDNTPGCTTEACDFTDSLKDFEKLNATVLGVSPDSVESHQKFIDKQNLKITLLSDPDKKVLEKYGAWGTKKMYGKETRGVIRSTFLIDPKGKIAHRWSNVRAKGHVAKVHEKLAELAG
ncbi:thioredoxin-dependent thiol peroxidase [candidate division GN15 bacterium]|nr:thioredoxin-dependent thiol peroxidase [candidate division GN15 bacterium]